MSRSERGSALILALVLSMVMMVLALGIAFVSTTDTVAADDMIAHGQALAVAEAGLAEAQRALRGREIDDLLNLEGTLPLFVGDGPSTYRDPVDLLDARSVDYNNPPAPKGSLQLRGLLTPGTGVALQGGHYFVRISDNDDGDGDVLRDSDAKFFIRAVGVFPCLPQETLTSAGSRLRNAVAVIEALFHRDLSLNVSAPFMIGGRDAEPAQNSFFNGNSFTLDGFDHSGMTLDDILQGGHRHDSEHAQAGFSVVFDDLEGGDAGSLLQTVYESLSRNQYNNIVGDEGPYGRTPSMRDDTETLRNSEFEDAQNLLNPAFLNDFIRRVRVAADRVYPDGTSLSGSDDQLGTEEEPWVVVAEGDLSVSGNGFGCGLLVVRGELSYQGAFNFNGLILVLGEGVADVGGANKSVVGGMFVANIEEDEEGNPSFGTARFTLSGNSNFFYRGASIRMAVSLLPLKMLSWREITAEIMPPV